MSLGLGLVLLTMYFIFSNRDERIAPVDIANRISIAQFVVYGGLALTVIGIILVLAAIVIRINHKRSAREKTDDNVSND